MKNDFANRNQRQTGTWAQTHFRREAKSPRMSCFTASFHLRRHLGSKETTASEGNGVITPQTTDASPPPPSALPSTHHEHTPTSSKDPTKSHLSLLSSFLPR